MSATPRSLPIEPKLTGAKQAGREPEGEQTARLAQLEREVAYYKTEYNDIGARLFRLQEEQIRVSREARRNRISARLIRDAYQLVNQDLDEAGISQAMLAIIADSSFCDSAAILCEEAGRPGCFTVDYAQGMTAGHNVTVEASVPDFFFTASRNAGGAAARQLMALLDVPYVLWAYDAANHRALLLGNRIESNIHRAYEADDRELVEGALAVYIDVLFRKHAETTLRLAKTAAEDANNARARFMATLNHELRNPLNAIIGFSELLLQDNARVQTAEQRAEFLHQILDSGKSLMSLVRDILDFSSLSNAQPLLRLDWLDAALLLQAAMRSFAAEKVRRQITIELLPVMPGLQIRGDYERLRQVLSNLIGNALKFTPAGGAVTLAAVSGPQGGQIIISDTGVGIDPAEIPRAFEPFVQLENALSWRSAGTGLGLPISKQLVEAHQGRLEINSGDGLGTVVTITLPPANVRHVTETSETEIETTKTGAKET